MIRIPFTVSDPNMYDPSNRLSSEYDPERGGWYKTEEKKPIKGPKSGPKQTR